MVRDPNTGRRLHQRTERNWSIEVPDEYSYDLSLLPSSATYRYLAERAARDGVQITTAAEVLPRPVDAPLIGQGAVMPRDARDMRDGRPLIYWDMRAGRVPIIYINPAQEHLEELKDRVDEMRHYGQDVIEEREQVDMQDVWLRYNEMLRRKKAGRKTFGAQTRGQF